MDNTRVADTENTVGELYKDASVAQRYVSQRFQQSWSRLLHSTQVGVIEQYLCTENSDSVLEIAPGPARIAVNLTGVKRGVMVDYSPQMLDVASTQLEESGKSRFWTVKHGNAFKLQELSESFDFVYTFRFIRHFRVTDRTRIYESLKSVIKDGGLLVLDVVGRKMRDRLDARSKREEGGLGVYDVTYTPDEFCREMVENGFEVISMKPVVAHFVWQQTISHRLDRRLPRLSKSLVRILERIPTRAPLEWVATCRKL